MSKSLIISPGMYLLVLFTLYLVSSSEAIRFNLQPGTRRCLKEEMRKGILTTSLLDHVKLVQVECYFVYYFMFNL